MIAFLKRFTKYDFVFHQLFNATVLVKAVAGILEIGATFFLLLLPLDFLNHQLPKMLEHMSSPWIYDMFTRHINHFLTSLQVDTQFFIITYIAIYGFANLCLTAALISNNKITYRFSIHILVVFIFYMIFRLLRSFSFVLLMLIVWDMIAVFLVYYEYQKFLQKQWESETESTWNFLKFFTWKK